MNEVSSEPEIKRRANPIRRGSNGKDRIVEAGADIMRRIERAIRVDPRQGTAAERMIHVERAANKNLTVSLNGKGVDGSIRAQTRIKRNIHRAAIGQTHQAAAGEAVEVRERTGGINEPVARRRFIDGKCPDGIIRPQAGVKRTVQRTRSKENTSAIGGEAVKDREISCDDGLAIILQRDGAHDAIETVARRKGEIGR